LTNTQNNYVADGQFFAGPPITFEQSPTTLNIISYPEEYVENISFDAPSGNCIFSPIFLNFCKEFFIGTMFRMVNTNSRSKRFLNLAHLTLVTNFQLEKKKLTKFSAQNVTAEIFSPVNYLYIYEDLVYVGDTVTLYGGIEQPGIIYDIWIKVSSISGTALYFTTCDNLGYFTFDYKINQLDVGALAFVVYRIVE
jgi:hypothetical protein